MTVRSIISKTDGMFLPCFVALTAAIALDLWFIVPPGADYPEQSGVELATVGFYLAATYFFFVLVPAERWRAHFAIPVFALLCAAREMDFDKAFTSRGILSLRHYTGDASLVSKLVGAAFVLLILIIAARLILKGAGPLLNGLRKREPWAYITLSIPVLLMVTKTLDGLDRKLFGLGISAAEPVLRLAVVLEEAGEALIPVAMIVALATAYQMRKA